MSADLCEAVKIYARYEIPDENGETRRERNEKHDFATPSLIVPEDGLYLWDWYHELRNWAGRIENGVRYHIPPSEFFAWSEITGKYPSSEEMKILHEMDIEFSSEVNKELKAFNERQKEEQRREFDEAKRRKK